MTLIFETEKYRNKVDKDFIILVLQINIEDEYGKPVYIWKAYDPYNKVFNNKKTDSTWYVSLDYNFLETWEKMEVMHLDFCLIYQEYIVYHNQAL